VKLFPILVPAGTRRTMHGWPMDQSIQSRPSIPTQYVYGGLCSVELVSGLRIRTPYRMWRVTGGA
jgi:hypothetical protein